MTSPILSLDRDALLRLDSALTQEWLETDGLGGAASSTVLLCPTRKGKALYLDKWDGIPVNVPTTTDYAVNHQFGGELSQYIG